MILIYFDVLSQNFPGGAEKNSDNSQQDGGSPGWDMNLGIVEYEVVAILDISLWGGMLVCV